MIDITDELSVQVQKDYSSLCLIVGAFAKHHRKKVPVLRYLITLLCIAFLVILDVRRGEELAESIILASVSCIAILAIVSAALPGPAWVDDEVTGDDLSVIRGLSDFSKNLLIPLMKLNGGRLTYTDIDHLLTELIPEMERLERDMDIRTKLNTDHVDHS